jgi:membrane associated rhomboid family serine protease
MGIYDRDYLRREPPRRGAYGRGGLAAARTWSVTTWIIVICAAVFVIDGLLGPRLTVLKTDWSVDPETIDRGALVEGPEQVRAYDRGRPVLADQMILLKTPEGLVPVGVNRLTAMGPLERALHFSTYRGFLRVEFWRLVGFQFLHANLMHLVFNMIGLFFFGPIVENYLGRKRYLAFYLLCGICGALLYVVLNLGGIVATEIFKSSVRIPGLVFNDMATPLIGASAGVFGVLMAGAYLAPNEMVLVLFFLPLRLQTFAYLLVAVAFITVLTHGENAGGEAGHLGGAMAGWYFIRHAHHLHGFFDLVGWIDPTSHHYRGRRRRAGPRGAATVIDRAEIDRILDKIHNQGLGSLSERERSILRDVTRE